MSPVPDANEIRAFNIQFALVVYDDEICFQVLYNAGIC